MKLPVYKDIVDIVQQHGTRDDYLQVVTKIYPQFSVKTLGSIYSQEYQRKMKKCHYKHYNAAKMEEYYQRYEEEVERGAPEGILLRMAQEIDFSPAMLSRIILDKYVTSTEGGSVSKSVLTQMSRDTALIDDPVLAHEVQMCVLVDDNYGPLVDSIKHSIGHEYEFLLKRKVEEKELAYLGEDQMRTKGYDKTPDIKLEVPIAVDGYVVNWIESKASFGDEESNKTYLKEQFWSYWNRFGPGLVIYWFGFIEDLNVNQDKGILLMDHFPEQITIMDPSSVKTGNSS